MTYTTLDLERHMTQTDVAKNRVALKLALTALHSRSAQVLQRMEDSVTRGESIDLLLLRSEFTEVMSAQDLLERSLERLDVVERIAAGVK